MPTNEADIWDGERDEFDAHVCLTLLLDALREARAVMRQRSPHGLTPARLDLLQTILDRRANRDDLVDMVQEAQDAGLLPD